MSPGARGRPRPTARRAGREGARVAVACADCIIARERPSTVAGPVLARAGARENVLSAPGDLIALHGEGVAVIRSTLVALPSAAVERPRASNANYGVAKAGLDALAQGLADASSSSGVRVLVVRPAFVKTGMTGGVSLAAFANEPETLAEAPSERSPGAPKRSWCPREQTKRGVLVQHDDPAEWLGALAGSAPAAGLVGDGGPADKRLMKHDGLHSGFAKAAWLVALLCLAGCGSGASAGSAPLAAVARARPQTVEPTAGVEAGAFTAADPVGDPNAHAPSVAVIRRELRLELVAVRVTDATYVDPLQYVNHWERTDQGVDANMPVGAPILAPCRVKILAIEPDWYAGQPLVYWELLEGADAGKVQYVAEEITDIAPPGSILQQGQAIARYAPSGTGIEFGWSTIDGITLARATTGHGGGQITLPGRSMRAWLNSLGANAGPDF
jgi:enoyl-ACP reductase-like protein